MKTKTNTSDNTISVGTTTGSSTNVPYTPTTVDYTKYLQQIMQTMPSGPFASPAKPVKKDYEARMTSRVAVPVRNPSMAGGSLEMTVGGEGEYVDFTFIQAGRQAMPFSVHRKDLEALFGQLTLDKLAK